MPSGLDRLLALPRFADDTGAYRPGLDRVRRLLHAMGDPHRAAPVVHVGGTNGKGSTASLVAALATASGRRAGLLTSPTLLHPAEMARVDGVPQVGAFAAAADRWGAEAAAIGCSFFEAAVALSFAVFAEARVDLAVVEVGLGGADDATAVVDPAVSVVTSVGLDHLEHLGATTRPEVARVKAGIAAPGGPFLHAVEGAETVAALEAEARRRGGVPERVRETVRLRPAADGLVLETEGGRYGPVALGLPGAHQRWNAALAVRAVEALGLGGSREGVEQGLRDVVRLAGLRGRSEAWAGDPRVVLDVAHNADGLRAARDAVPVPPGGRLVVLLGMMADKAGPAVADALRGARVRTVSLDTPRARSAAALARRLRSAGLDAVTEAGGVAEAIHAFRWSAGPDDRLLVTGSHRTVAEALRAIEGVSG
jgi:dihydrofolate synthase/folylpolyglutamate synthase